MRNCGGLAKRISDKLAILYCGRRPSCPAKLAEMKRTGKAWKWTDGVCRTKAVDTILEVLLRAEIARMRKAEK
jgi:hypothetical protein